MARLASQLAGIGGAIALAQQENCGLLNHGFASPLPTLLLNWPLFVWTVLLIIGPALRPILRRWLRALIRRVRLRVPSPS